MKNTLHNERTITFIVSLIIASSLWLLIKLTGDFQTDRQLHIHFQNLPPDKVLLKSSDSLIQVRTNKNGFNALSELISGKQKSLNVDFSNAKYLSTKNGIRTYFLFSSSLAFSISETLSAKEVIVSIRPDTLFIRFQPLSSKKLKVELNVDLSLSPRYKQYLPYQLNPDSIRVYGTHSALETIQKIRTEKLTFKNADRSIDTNVNLAKHSKDLIFEKENIGVKIDIEEFTESKMKLPILPKLNSGARYKLFPSEATIVYQVALKDYSKIKVSDFLLEALPDSLVSGKLNLKLNKQPENIIISSIQPSVAEYIILK
jgi:hypothetical protein